MCFAVKRINLFVEALCVVASTGILSNLFASTAHAESLEQRDAMLQLQAGAHQAPWNANNVYPISPIVFSTFGLETALAEFVKPRFLRSRTDIESGYSEDLISTEAVVLAKLAWRNGYEANIDSPYIPKEWLPVQPLERYDDEFDFMKAYTIDPTWGRKVHISDFDASPVQ